MAGRVARGDIRLFRFPEPDKQRPVLVLTRDAMIDRLGRVTVAPLTSTVRGVPSEVVIGTVEGMKDTCAVNLHNIVTVPKGGLGRLVARLEGARLDQVCAAIGWALGCGGQGSSPSE